MLRHILTYAPVPAAGRGFVWQAAAYTFVWVLAACVAALLAVQFAYFGVASLRARRRRAMKAAVLDAVARLGAAKTREERQKVRVHGTKSLFDRRGLAVLSQVFDDMSEAGRSGLRALVINMGGSDYISAQLQAARDDHLVEVVRMVGILDLVGLDSRVAALMYTHRDSIELQFAAFLTLAQLGSKDNIIKLCMDDTFVHPLSFRSLQQVLKAYSADKEDLYAALLSSPDAYVVRICIRRAGIEGFEGLCGKIAPRLSSENYNLVADATRALGLLRWQPAAAEIAALLKHERWEVRSVAATALAGIARDDYAYALADALCDREWQVRYNAAAALRGCPSLAAIRERVLAGGDRYALEMLDFMTRTAEIWGQAE